MECCQNDASQVAKVPPVNWLAVYELQVHNRINQQTEQKTRAPESDVVNDEAARAVLPDYVPVPPVTEEKWQLETFIHEVHFTGARFVFGNPALPCLTEKEEVNPQVHLVAGLITIVAQKLYLRERWTQGFK